MPEISVTSAPLQQSVDFWPLCVPLLLGLGAVYLLLPRPRLYPRWLGALLAVAALFSGGRLMIRGELVEVETILFCCFSLIAIVSGGLMITQVNPVRAALSFALVVLSTCGLFLLQAAPFLMAATIIVYAGAIVVTFLFVIMLAQQAGNSDADQRSREPLMAAIAGFMLLGALLYSLRMNYDTRQLDAVLERVHRVAEQKTLADIEQEMGGKDKEDNFFVDCGQVSTQPPGRARETLERIALKHQTAWGKMLDKSPNDVEGFRKVLHDFENEVRIARNGYGSLQPSERLKLSPFSAAGVRLNSAPGTTELKADNTAALGRALFTDYLLAVELAGMLLLVAAIGAIAIAQRRPEGAR